MRKFTGKSTEMMYVFIRDVNYILGFIPATSMLCFIVMIGCAFLVFGEFPVYGKHPDPYSLNLSWLSLIALLFTFICFFTIPASFLITLHLIFNKIKLNTSDISSLLISLTSIGLFLFLKQESAIFNWITD